jgi:uncharacterized membrane protein
MKYIGWPLFIFLAIGIGLYPLMYILAEEPTGVLQNRPLLSSPVWKWAFYQHISFGGIALLSGFSQFSQRLRIKSAKIHRTLGKIYILSVLLSGIAGLYVAIYTLGGLPAQLGFTGLAIGWLLTSWLAYSAIRGGQVNRHQRWMIRSYALTWAAVTLRIYLPLFEFGFGMNFQMSYPIIAWLCWVPNLLVAEWIIGRLNYSKK